VPLWCFLHYHNSELLRERAPAGHPQRILPLPGPLRARRYASYIHFPPAIVRSIRNIIGSNGPGG